MLDMMGSLMLGHWIGLHSRPRGTCSRRGCVEQIPLFLRQKVIGHVRSSEFYRRQLSLEQYRLTEFPIFPVLALC